MVMLSVAVTAHVNVVKTSGPYNPEPGTIMAASSSVRAQSKEAHTLTTTTMIPISRHTVRTMSPLR